MALILNGTDGLSDVDGTASTPAIRGTDANTGMFFPAADTIAFSEGGVESMRLNSSGVLVTTNDASISGLTVGKGAGSVSLNTAVGVTALVANTTGNGNTGIGKSALGANTTADQSTAVGYAALQLSTGAQNTSVGANSSQSTTTGTLNSALGYGAFSSNTTGSNNIAIGAETLASNSTGSFNVAVGRQALIFNTTASNNTAVGYQAGYSNTTGIRSTLIGTEAGYSANPSSSVGNTLVGWQAGYNSTGNGNTFLGVNGTDAAVGWRMTTGSKNTILGGYSGNQGGLDIRTASNNIVLSDGDGNPRIYWNGAQQHWFIPSAPLLSPYIFNTTGAGSGTVVVGSDGNLFRSSSSARYKKDIVDARFGLIDLLKLRAVNYEGNGEQDTDKLLGGLIAEEVDEAGLHEFVVYDEQNRPDAIHYAQMVALCVKSIQELNTKLEAQALEIAQLKGN